MLPGPPQLGPPASYLVGAWFAAPSDQPVWYWDELDDERWSIRCVRKYRDGILKAYSFESPNWRDEMPEAPWPLIDEINKDPECDARQITRDRFEAIWEEANRAMRTTA